MPSVCDCSEAQALLRERAGGKPKRTSVHANAEQSRGAMTGRSGGPGHDGRECCTGKEQQRREQRRDCRMA